MEETIDDRGNSESSSKGAETHRRTDVRKDQEYGVLSAARPISIVIICRNNLHLTKLAIRSAMAQDVPVEVLAVDNCSTDGTSQWLATKHLTAIFPQKQMSLSWCWNTALRALWKAGHDRALVINNDVEIRPDTVRLLDAHGGPFVTCVSVESADQIGVAGDRVIEDLRPGEREHPDFSCFLIRKSVTERIGWFNEECFPAYCEDSFYHVRMHQAGIRAVCIDLPFLHHGAGTVKSALPGERARIERGAMANRERFRQKYGCLPGSDDYERLFV